MDHRAGLIVLAVLTLVFKLDIGFVSISIARCSL